MIDQPTGPAFDLTLDGRLPGYQLGHVLSRRQALNSRLD
jgi:hypothetical protein